MQDIRLLKQDLDRMLSKKERIEKELENSSDWMLEESLKQLNNKISQSEQKLTQNNINTVKLTQRQQEVYNELLDAEIQPYIKDDSLEYNQYKNSGYIDDNGKFIRFSNKTWASNSNLKLRKICKGHSTTLKALEKKGVIKCVDIGGIFDILEINQAANTKVDIPPIYKFIISHYNNTWNDYFFGTSIEGIKKYLPTIHYNMENIDNIKIDDKQNFTIEYMNF
jgi:hypothetical protein